MRRMLVSLLAISALALIPAAKAQDVGGSFYYDFQSRAWAPVASVKITDLPDFAGVKGLTPQVRGFAGIANARGLAGVAVVFSTRVARNANGEFGIGGRAATGRKIGLGIFAGISIKL